MGSRRRAINHIYFNWLYKTFFVWGMEVAETSTIVINTVGSIYTPDYFKERKIVSKIKKPLRSDTRIKAIYNKGQRKI